MFARWRGWLFIRLYESICVGFLKVPQVPMEFPEGFATPPWRQSTWMEATYWCRVGPWVAQNLGANIFHIWCPISVGLFPIKGDGCAQVDWIDLGKKTSAHIAFSMRKGKSPKMTSCGSTTLRWRTSSKRVKKHPILFGSSSIIILINIIINYPKF